MSLRIVVPSSFTDIVDTQKVTSKSPIRKPTKVDLKIACMQLDTKVPYLIVASVSFLTIPLRAFRLSEEFSQTYLIRPSSFLFCLRRIRFLLNKSKKLNCLHVNTIHYNCISDHLLAIIVIKTIILFWFCNRTSLTFRISHVKLCYLRVFLVFMAPDRPSYFWNFRFWNTAETRVHANYFYFFFWVSHNPLDRIRIILTCLR